MSQYCQAGEALTRQLDKTLSLVSQFAYVHNDATLLSLAMARKPSVSVMSVAGETVKSIGFDLDLENKIVVQISFGLQAMPSWPGQPSRL